ncbi:hypothetical protein BDN67DRAFT_1069598, partial [Paxillus ammoniavirescens]
GDEGLRRDRRLGVRRWFSLPRKLRGDRDRDREAFRCLREDSTCLLSSLRGSRGPRPVGTELCIDAFKSLLGACTSLPSPLLFVYGYGPLGPSL